MVVMKYISVAKMEILNRIERGLIDGLEIYRLSVELTIMA